MARIHKATIMKQELLKEIEMGSKNALLKKKIITHYIYNGSSTLEPNDILYFFNYQIKYVLLFVI